MEEHFTEKTHTAVAHQHQNTATAPFSGSDIRAKWVLLRGHGLVSSGQLLFYRHDCRRRVFISRSPVPFLYTRLAHLGQRVIVHRSFGCFRQRSEVFGVRHSARKLCKASGPKLQTHGKVYSFSLERFDLRCFCIGGSVKVQEMIASVDCVGEISTIQGQNKAAMSSENMELKIKTTARDRLKTVIRQLCVLFKLSQKSL